MSDSKKRTLQIFSFINSGLLVLTGIMVLFQLIRIYSGDSTPLFTREGVGKHLLELLPLFIALILFVAFTSVYFVIVGVSKRNGVELSYEQKYKVYTKRMGVLKAEDGIRQERFRLAVRIVSCAIFAICLALCFTYIFIPGHFDPKEEVTKQVVDSLIHFAPWLLISLVCFVIANILLEKSYKRSLEILSKNKVALIKLETKRQKLVVLWSIRGVIFSIAVFLIVYGAIKGDAKDVLIKARNICSECIGLG